MYKLIVKKPVYTITHHPIVVDEDLSFNTYYSMVNYVSRIFKSLPESAYFVFSSSDDPFMFHLNLVSHEF